MTDLLWASTPFKIHQILYRYKAIHVDYCFERIDLCKYIVTKVTPKGGWISCSTHIDRDRFVLHSGAKRYAYPLREEAWESFKYRTNMRKRILCSQLAIVDAILKIAGSSPPKDHRP